MVDVTVLSGRADRRYLLANEFAFLKAADKLQPEQLGFRVLTKRERHDLLPRPYHHAYINRRMVGDQNSVGGRTEPVYSEESLAQALRDGRSPGFVLLGRPLDGKTRTLYQTIPLMKGYLAVMPHDDRHFPSDEAISYLESKRGILIVNDLEQYAGSDLNLSRLVTRLRKKNSDNWLLAATCKDGNDLKIVKETTQAGLKDFYAIVGLELRFDRLTPQEKDSLAVDVENREYRSNESELYPTPGSIVMAEHLQYMRGRYSSLPSEQKPVLHALKLLSAAGVRPFSQQRLQLVLDEVLGRAESHLREFSRLLYGEGFLRHVFPDGTVVEEPAYLEYAVEYEEGRAVQDDFSSLKDALAKAEDADALFYLGVTHGEAARYSEALGCFDYATTVKPDFPEAWNDKGVALSNQGKNEEAIEAYNEAIRLKPDYPEAWYNKGFAFYHSGRNEQALNAFDEAIRLRSDVPDFWDGKGAALARLGRLDEATDWLLRAWWERERLSDKGSFVKEMLAELGIDPETLSDDPPKPGVESPE